MGLDVSRCHELLAADRRRVVLGCLNPSEPPVALADLAQQVAVSETDDHFNEKIDAPAVQRITLSLYHVHLPKLAGADVVLFDRDRQTVTAGPEFNAVRAFMEECNTTLA